MAKPSDKNPNIDKFLKGVLGVDRRAAIKGNVCALCGKAATEFRDALSRKEYSISGMCQDCQDDFFVED